MVWLLTAFPAQSNEHLNRWIEQGFSIQEAYLFDQGGFSISEAQAWLKRSFDAGHAVEWVKNGFTLQEAETWRKLGIQSGLHARQMVEQGYTLDYIRAWYALGVRSILDAKRLLQTGFTLENAKPWADLGYDPMDWIAFVKHGYQYEEAKAWRQLGFDSFIEVRNLTRLGFDLRQARAWAEAGIPYQDWQKWKQAGFTMDEILLWKAVGIHNPNTARQLRQLKISTDAIQQWKNVSSSPTDWMEYRRAGISVDQAMDWKNAEVITPAQIEQYRLLGLTPKDVNRWRLAGVDSLHQLRTYLNAGINSPDTKSHWDALGITDAPRWAVSGISLMEAKEWVDHGFSDLTDVLYNVKRGVSPDKAKRRLTIPPFYWGVIGLIGLILLFFITAYWEEITILFGQIREKTRHRTRART